MTDDDICGYPTKSNGDCQHPTTEEGDADRCWMDAHNDSDLPDKQQPGRRSKLEDVREDILAAARAGASKQGCARAAGIVKSTLYEWTSPDSEYYDEEFHEDFLQARWQGELRYIRNPEDVDSRHAQFLLERSFGYTKEQTIEHEGDGLGEVTVSFADDEEE